MKNLWITGYRTHEIGIFKQKDPAVRFIKKAIEQKLRTFESVEWVLISGQLGTELWAAEVVLELKQERDLKLAILPATTSHEENWNDENKEYYRTIAAKADFVQPVSSKPYENPKQLQNRDRFLLEKSDGLLLFYDEEKEGSPKFLWEKVRKLPEDYPRFLLTFEDLQWIVEEESWNDQSFSD